MGRPKGSKDKRSVGERFWSKVRKTETCWLWTGAVNNHGYGRFWDGERVVLSHRFAWSELHGEEPLNFLLHSCDTPACVRPAHLRLGTQQDNMRDVLLRDRHHGRSKLNPEKVRKIRALCTKGTNDLAFIAKEFGISPAAVGHIKYRVTWAWLQ